MFSDWFKPERSKGVFSSHSYLDENDQVACHEVPYSANNWIIRKISPAQGRWVQSKFNNDIKQELSTGLDMETTDKDRSEVLREIRSSLEVGFKFGDESLSSVF